MGFVIDKQSHTNAGRAVVFDALRDVLGLAVKTELLCLMRVKKGVLGRM